MNAPDMMDGQQYVQLAREYSRATKGNGEYVSDDKIFSASELVAIEIIIIWIGLMLLLLLRG